MGVTKRQFNITKYSITERNHEFVQNISGYHKQEPVNFETHKTQRTLICQENTLQNKIDLANKDENERQRKNI